MCLGSVVARKHVLVRVVFSGCGGKPSVSVSLSADSDVVGRVFWVVRVFFLCASRCPMAVASNAGGYLFMVASERPGNGGRNPLQSAVLRVDIAGEKSAAWANATKSAGVLDCLLITGAARLSVPLVVGWGPVLWWVFAVDCGHVHRPAWLRGHWSCAPSGPVMVQCWLVKVTVHP